MKLPTIFLTCLTNFNFILCDANTSELFAKINSNFIKLNSIAAKITWESSLRPDNTELDVRTSNYQREWVFWQQTTCEQLATLEKRQSLSEDQRRQTYLLCRGPKYTYREARTLTSLYDELQSLYSNNRICIPTQRNISSHTLQEIESAILNYLSTVNELLGTKDGAPFASKMAAKNGPIEGFCLNGEDDFEKLIRSGRNEEVLKFLWLVWREKIGEPMKEPYKQLVDLENRAAWRNGYTDIGQSWREDLEIPNLRQKCRQLYSSIRPMYTLLHGVVRFYLRKQYGPVVPENGPIPAHLLGNLWSQNWETLIDLITHKAINLDESILKLNWTVHHMVKRVEDFYQSLLLPAMTDTFWRESKFEKQDGGTRCHGTAADMFQGGDFRLLYCSGKTIEDFYVLHHEFGHIQYYMAYNIQPGLFRQANAAFHESIGDAIMYGVMTPQHLHRLGLVNDSVLYVNSPASFIRSAPEQINKEKITDGLKTVESVFSKRHVSEAKHHLNEKDNKLWKTKDEFAFGEIMPKTKQHLNLEDKEGLLKTNEGPTFDGRYGQKTKHYRKVERKRANNKADEVDKDRRIDEKTNEYFDNSKTNENGEYPTEDIELENNLTTDEILLLKLALNKIPQIPFALVVDEYRWKYFEGGIEKDRLNGEFWDLSLELQGIAPPVDRSEEYFDIGAKFHVPDNTPYIRYFLSSFVQHQIFEALCRAAVFGRRDTTTPIPDTIALNRCDIYGSKSAGKLLKDFMSRGHSQHWKDILMSTTGNTDITAAALKRYYRPLYEVLARIVRKHNIPLGW